MLRKFSTWLATMSDPTFATVDDKVPRTGIGHAIGHHGELLQGVFQGHGKRLIRGLITLPLPALSTNARFVPSSGGTVRVQPSGKTKARRAARLALQRLGHSQLGGDLHIESSIPVGFGYGSSTADVVASIRAVVSACSAFLRPATIGRLAVAAELASDSTVFGDEAVLFAQREGTVIEPLGGSFPPLYLLSLGHRSASVVDTLKLPRARYTSAQILQFSVIRGLARHAIEHQDAALLGRVATASATISQQYLPQAGFETALQLSRLHEACGVQVSHSGSLIGILFDASKPEARRHLTSAARAAQAEGFGAVSAYSVFSDGVQP